MENKSREIKAEEFFLSGKNCSQSVFLAFADKYGLNEETASKISCGLGGGVGRMREVCGAVTGASLVFGLEYGDDKAAVYGYVQEFCRRFKEECGSIVCRELLEGTGATRGGSPEERTSAYYAKRPCVEMVKLAARILTEMGL